MSLNNDFLLLLFLKVCTSHVVVCSITNTVISLISHKLHQIHMNNQEKFTTRSSKLKVHRANSQTISLYPVRFSLNIRFSSLVSFAFSVFEFEILKVAKNVFMLQIFMVLFLLRIVVDKIYHHF